MEIRWSEGDARVSTHRRQRLQSVLLSGDFFLIEIQISSKICVLLFNYTVGHKGGMKKEFPQFHGYFLQWGLFRMSRVYTTSMLGRPVSSY